MASRDDVLPGMVMPGWPKHSNVAPSRVDQSLQKVSSFRSAKRIAQQQSLP